MQKYIAKNKDLIIILFSGLSNYIHFYLSFIETLKFDLLGIILFLLLPISGIVFSFMIAGVLWLSVPLYEYLANKEGKYQSTIPFSIFLLVVLFINIITFIATNKTFIEIFIKLLK